MKSLVQRGQRVGGGGGFHDDSGEDHHEIPTRLFSYHQPRSPPSKMKGCHPPPKERVGENLAPPSQIYEPMRYQE